MQTDDRLALDKHEGAVISQPDVATRGSLGLDLVHHFADGLRHPAMSSKDKPGASLSGPGAGELVQGIDTGDGLDAAGREPRAVVGLRFTAIAEGPRFAVFEIGDQGVRVSHDAIRPAGRPGSVPGLTGQRSSTRDETPARVTLVS